MKIIDNIFSIRNTIKILSIFFLFLFSNLIIAQNKSAIEWYEDGNLQRAAWAYNLENNYQKSEEIHEEIESLLLNLKIDESKTKPENDERGVARTFKVHFLNTHITALLKVKGSDYIGSIQYERASYKLSRELKFNLVPTVVIRTIEIKGKKYTGSLMYWIDNSKSASSAGLNDLNKSDLLKFFDAIIANGDRHSQNWLVTSEGKVVAVDHNRSFFHKDGTWLTHLKLIKNPIGIMQSEQYSYLKNLTKLQLVSLLSNVKKEKREQTWKALEDLKFELEKSVRIKGIIMHSNSQFGKVRFDLEPPILSKNSEVEKVLREIVEKHLPYVGPGIRLDGLFSVLLRDNAGETHTALGGLEVYRKDSKKIRKVLESAGFIIK